MTASEIKPTTLAQAIPQICILTPPIGALGNASNHSTYQGTHPLGTQNTGVLENQN